MKTNWIPAHEQKDLGKLMQVREWVNNRSDMSEVEEIDLSDYQLPTDVSNLSIYVVNNGHPSTLPVS